MGKLIVLEGTDGSGKSTQFAKMVEHLQLDGKQFRTIPIHIQYLQGSYGHVDLGAVMALIMMSIVPIVVFYLTCQKYIVSGVMAGAVKG